MTPPSPPPPPPPPTDPPAGSTTAPSATQARAEARARAWAVVQARAAQGSARRAGSPERPNRGGPVNRAASDAPDPASQLHSDAANGTAAPTPASSTRSTAGERPHTSPTRTAGAEGGPSRDGPRADRPRAASERSERRLVRSSGRYASAGRIIGVMLVCFGLWLLLDANQLYRSAENGGAYGSRRTVSMDVLRPIAAVSNALHLSALVNWGSSALNQAGAPGSNQNLPAPVLTVPTPAPLTQLPDGLSYLPHGRHPNLVVTTPPAFPPIVQPTVAQPLAVLDIGDSIGEDLGFGLGDLFSGDSFVNIVQKGVEDTGLADPSYYNWPGHLQEYLNKYHPGAVVIMMGANDDKPIAVNGVSIAAGTTQWVKAYTVGVDTLMEESIAAGAEVMWVGLPPMGGGNITNGFVKQVNQIYQAQAKLHPGVTYVGSWSLLSTPNGKFEVYKKINGSEVAVRSTDGVHLDPPGWDLLARALVQPMQRTWRINLHVAS